MWGDLDRRTQMQCAGEKGEGEYVSVETIQYTSDDSISTRDAGTGLKFGIMNEESRL